MFPSRGRFPLAEAIQNGEYDGDGFWVCWESSLVGPFKNILPLVNLPSLEGLDVKVDSTTLREILSDPIKGTEEFLRSSFHFRCGEIRLGQCSRLYERMAYWKNSLVVSVVERLATLREYLVDAPKNGYRFE